MLRTFQMPLVYNIIQLLTSISVDMRIYLLEVNMTFKGRKILMSTEIEVNICFVI